MQSLPGRKRGASRILVTGASSGIGAALARHYAGSGRRLMLWGRDRTRLDAVASECRARGAEAETRSIDLADPQAARAALALDDDAFAFDLAILAAGLGDIRPDGALTERPELVIELGCVNFTTPAMMATLLAGHMAARGGGRIGLLGSVAAFHDLPYAPAYAGSKAGLTRFAAALRLGMRDHGVSVTLASPGFVDTPMSRRLDCAKPFLLDVETAAARIARAVDAGRAHLVLPWPFSVLRAAQALLPGPVARAILTRTRVVQTPRG